MVLFNSYHYAENLIAIIYSTLPFKENKQNIPPCEKEICHIFYYFRAFIADRDVDSESHQYENLQTPPSQLLEGTTYIKEEGTHPTPASVFTQSILLQLSFSSSFPVLNQNNAMKYLILVSFHFLTSLQFQITISSTLHLVFGGTERLVSGNSKTILMGFYGSFTLCFRDWHKRKNLGYCPLKNTLTARQLECNLEFNKDFDNNLYLPNIC